MQVEDVTRIRLTAWWAAQQQRHLTIGLSLLRKVVVDNEGVLTLFHPVLAHCATGVWSKVFERRRVGSRSGHHDGVLHSAGLAKRLDGLSDG